MPYIQVDVDLDDFDLDDILEELEYRYNSSFNQKKNRKQITEAFKDMVKEAEEPERTISLVDAMKIDLLKNNLHKISLNDLEQLIK